MMTSKQCDLLLFIHSRLERDGVPPSFDEMRDALDLRSKSGVHRLITGLEERGFIRRLPHRARAIEILKLPEAMETSKAPSQMIAANSASIGIPVMGQIAAGVPIEAIQQNTRELMVAQEMVGAGEHFALEVRGESMIDEGIHDGDLVIIKEQDTAENGEIIVALVEEQEATLKRFRKKGNAIALEAANPAYETRVYRADQVRIQGKLVGLVRTYN